MTRTAQLPPRADAAPMTERQLQDAVVDAAKMLGWQCYHTWHSIHSAPGFPDLVLVRPPRIVFAELKSERGHLTYSQERWLSLLQQCPGVEVQLWRPLALTEGLIAEVLSTRMEP